MFKTSIGSRDRSARDPPMQWLPAAKSRDRRRCRRAAIARLASRLLFTSLAQRKILSRWEDTAVSSRACSEKRCGWVSTEKDEWGLLLPATLWTWRQVCPRSWEGRWSCGWRPPGARCLPRWTRSRQRWGATWLDPWRTEYCQQKRYFEYSFVDSPGGFWWDLSQERYLFRPHHKLSVWTSFLYSIVHYLIFTSHKLLLCIAVHSLSYLMMSQPW